MKLDNLNVAVGRIWDALDAMGIDLDGVDVKCYLPDGASINNIRIELYEGSEKELKAMVSIN